MWAASLATVLAVTGCGVDVAPPQTVLVDEVAAHDGQVCPRQLPAGEDPHGRGFGTNDSATAKPSLLNPESAWVCRYLPVQAGPGPDGDGARFVWQREGEPKPLSRARLATAVAHLSQLQPQGDVNCTSDLGQRLMLVYLHARDLTGVVIDDYGCRSVRLTNDPFSRAPGDPGQEGTVPGRLRGPAQLLDELKSV